MNQQFNDFPPLQNLTIEESSYMENFIAQHKKKAAIAWLLWFFFGGIGAHRYYLGQNTSGLILALVTIFISPWTYFVPTAIWLFVDIFMIPNMLRENEEMVRQTALQNISMMRQTN